MKTITVGQAILEGHTTFLYKEKEYRFSMTQRMWVAGQFECRSNDDDTWEMIKRDTKIDVFENKKERTKWEKKHYGKQYS